MLHELITISRRSMFERSSLEWYCHDIGRLMRFGEAGCGDLICRSRAFECNRPCLGTYLCSMWREYHAESQECTSPFCR